jgi:hypothetical protein
VPLHVTGGGNRFASQSERDNGNGTSSKVDLNADGNVLKSELELLTMGNVMVGNGYEHRLWVHLAMTFIVSLAVVYAIFQMLGEAARLRQRYMGYPEDDETDGVHLRAVEEDEEDGGERGRGKVWRGVGSKELAARTLMVRDVPVHFRTPERLAGLFNRITRGQVEAVVVPRKVSNDMIKLKKQRSHLRDVVERVGTRWVMGVVKEALKSKKTGVNEEVDRMIMNKDKKEKREDMDFDEYALKVNEGEMSTGNLLSLATATPKSKPTTGRPTKPTIIVDFVERENESSSHANVLGSELTLNARNSASNASPSSNNKNFTLSEISRNPNADEIILNNDAKINIYEKDHLPVSSVFTSASKTETSHKLVVNTTLSETETNAHQNPSFHLRLRPRHRTQLFGWSGDKVDSLTHYARKLREIQHKIENVRSELSPVSAAPSSPSLPQLNIEDTSTNVSSTSSDLKQINPNDLMPTAFILFKDILSPHISASISISAAPVAMSERIPNVEVKDVLWENSQLSFTQKQLRKAIARLGLVALTVFRAVLSKLLFLFILWFRCSIRKSLFFILFFIFNESQTTL